MAKFFRNVSGAVAVITAMTFPLLLGFGSLGIEVGHWYLTQRQMQGAADAAAISAATEFIRHVDTASYQDVGVQYAGLNGFTIPSTNVCLYRSDGNNCSMVQSLDARPISCPAAVGNLTWACIVVEITQNTMNWLTTQRSAMPAAIGHVQGIATPVLKARAVVAIKITTTGPTTTEGANCILAKANNAQAVYVENNNNLIAGCGIAIDGGASGGIDFKNPGDLAHISSLAIAGTAECPPGRCFLYGTNTPLAAVHKATPDPYTAALNFTNPLGAKTVTRGAQGTGYTGSSCTFNIDGTSQSAKLQATISGGKVTAVTVVDPGAYAAGTVLPSSGAVTCGGGSGATYTTLTQGCFDPNNLPKVGGKIALIAGRTYCSLNLDNLAGDIPAGNYYLEPGQNIMLGNARSAPGGTTFYLTNGGIDKVNGNVTPKLCAPGTVAAGKACGDDLNPDHTTNQTCDNIGSCFLFIQNSNRGATTVNIIQGSAVPIFSGLIYLPNETLQITGNGNIGGCFGVVAQYIDLRGSTTFSNGCLPGDGIGGTTTPGTQTASAPFLFQ